MQRLRSGGRPDAEVTVDLGVVNIAVRARAAEEADNPLFNDPFFRRFFRPRRFRCARPRCRWHLQPRS